MNSNHFQPKKKYFDFSGSMNSFIGLAQIQILQQQEKTILSKLNAIQRKASDIPPICGIPAI